MTNATTKKTIGQNKAASTTTPATTKAECKDTKEKNTNTAPATTTDNTGAVTTPVEKKEEDLMKKSNVVPLPVKKGGLTKEMRDRKDARLRELKALQIGKIMNDEALKADPAKFAQAMLDLDKAVLDQYIAENPKTRKKRDPENKPRKSAQYTIGKFLKKYEGQFDVNKIKEFFLFALEHPLYAKDRPDLRGKKKAA